MSTVRALPGAASGFGRVVFGPCLVERAYMAPRDYACEIAPKEGEIAVVIAEGDPCFLGKWVVGPAAEVVAWLSRVTCSKSEYERVARILQQEAPTSGWCECARHREMRALAPKVQAVLDASARS